MFLRQVVVRHAVKMTVNINRLPQAGLRSPIARLFAATPDQSSGKKDQEPKAASLDVEGSDNDFRPKEKATVGTSDKEVLDQIDRWVKENKVCLFMKGNPQMPMCGYSKFVVEVLKFYNVKNYKSVDVIKDPNVRRLLKEYSDWPTFPQLYVNGELIGGSDIVTEMHKNGTLKDVLSK